jgi:hypothetical protein
VLDNDALQTFSRLAMQTKKKNKKGPLRHERKGGLEMTRL